MDKLGELFGPLAGPIKVEVWEKDAKPASLVLVTDDVAARLGQQMRLAIHDPIARIFWRQAVLLYVVDRNGSIWLALEEIAERTGEIPPEFTVARQRFADFTAQLRKFGHPTLVDGQPARIAGEILLEYDEESKTFAWEINAKSGRYNKGAERTEAHLNNVAEALSKLDVNLSLQPYREIAHGNS